MLGSSGRGFLCRCEEGRDLSRPVSRYSSRQLIADRQLLDALAGGSEDGIAKRRRERRNAWLADAARRHAERIVDDVHLGLDRRLVDAHELEVVEVRLLDGTVLERDRAILGESKAHHRRAFDLRADPFGMYAVAAIDGGIDA